jgi:multisubunit Na+/H+ antiporter MnhE subunit
MTSLSLTVKQVAKRIVADKQPINPTLKKVPETLTNLFLINT